MFDTELHLSDKDLRTIVRLVYERSGITLHDGKRALVAARLQKRVRTGGFQSYGDYIRHVEMDGSGEELVQLLDAIATNHTSFFREPQHFQLLRERVLPPLVARGAAARIAGWSAACSSGEEPYTLAMTLREAVPAALHPQVSLLASDISTKVLRTATDGIYRMDRLEGLSIEQLRRHFEKGQGSHAGHARVQPAVRQLVEFARLNLLEIVDLHRRFAFIFCRNVMIYFDRPVQQRVVAMLERHLLPGGHLFISHSESLNGITHGLQWVAPAVYRRSEP
jgi:chemotaxis protein methyltransferase CheR